LKHFHNLGHHGRSHSFFPIDFLQRVLIDSMPHEFPLVGTSEMRQLFLIRNCGNRSQGVELSTVEDQRRGATALG
jgi:hypothetical protein